MDGLIMMIRRSVSCIILFVSVVACDAELPDGWTYSDADGSIRGTAEYEDSDIVLVPVCA